MVVHSILPALRLILVNLVLISFATLKIYSFWYEGNADTDMARGHGVGALQADGRMATEPTFDVEHVASTVVHIASMPPDVAMLEVNIMCDRGILSLKYPSNQRICRAAGMPYVGRG